MNIVAGQKQLDHCTNPHPDQNGHEQVHQTPSVNARNQSRLLAIMYPTTQPSKAAQAILVHVFSWTYRSVTSPTLRQVSVACFCQSSSFSVMSLVFIDAIVLHFLKKPRPWKPL